MHTDGHGRCRWRAKRASPPRLRGRGADAGLPLCFLKWLTDEEGERRMKKGKKIIGIVIAVVIILVIMAAFGGGSFDGEKKEIVESVTEVASEKENRQEKVLDRIFLEEILGTLEAKERRLIYMRYFQNMTQMEIAHELGVSQVQVSRMEKRILRSLQESAEKK